MIQTRVIQLNMFDLTDSKRHELAILSEEYNKVAKQTFEIWKQNIGVTQTELHHLTYKKLRKESDLPAQLVISARVSIWNRRKIAYKLEKIPIRFDNRSFKYSKTEKGNPIICISSYRKGMLAIPISKDGAFQRFQKLSQDEWTFNSILIKKSKILIIFQKEFIVQTPKPGQKIIGIDVGSATLSAVTVYGPVEDKALKQLYFGRDIALKRKKIEERREKLQSRADRGSDRAKKHLKKLETYETNFVKTRCWQVTHEIVDLTKKFDATIAIEDLTHLRKAMKFGKKTNKKVHKIPYARFFHSSGTVSVRNLVSVTKIDPKNTSRTCPKCGRVSKNNRSVWSTFRCKCGYTANADRTASQNISKKLNSVLERKHFQISKTGVPVNAPVRFDDGVKEGPRPVLLVPRNTPSFSQE